jgi:hypothetical protein
MNIIKGLGVFFLVILISGSCFDPPEFPIVPEIEYEDIEFVDGDTDSLILHINFRDGDGDLGLDNANLEFLSDPYNSVFFFQENNGKISKLTTFAATNQIDQYDILVIPNPQQGKLVFPRTRKKPEYDSIPPYDCPNYEYVSKLTRKLLIEHADLAVLDERVIFLDTLPGQNANGQSTSFYQIQDTLLIQVNPEHYNIEVDFLVKNGSTFEPFDWRETFCQTFDGRFPELAKDDGVPLEGTLKYTMNSVGFGDLFRLKTLKLRIQVKDRLRHRSNVIETPEFTLDKIRK